MTDGTSIELAFIVVLRFAILIGVIVFGWHWFYLGHFKPYLESLEGGGDAGEDGGQQAAADEAFPLVPTLTMVTIVVAAFMFINFALAFRDVNRVHDPLAVQHQQMLNERARSPMVVAPDSEESLADKATRLAEEAERNRLEATGRFDELPDAETPPMPTNADSTEN